MLRGDAHIGGRKRDLHAAFASFAVRIGAAGFGGRRNLAVTHGDFFLIEIFNAERVAKRAG